MGRLSRREFMGTAAMAGAEMCIRDSGMASNLIERAADVCLKERRPLILCVRESPFNRIHLRNMQLASDAGATIFPVMPTLYNQPQSTTEMARQFVDRVLAHVGLPQPGAFEWKG